MKMEEYHIKSLQQLCVQRILQLPVFESVDMCWNLYNCAACDLQHPELRRLKDKLITKVRDGFPYLLQKYGEEELKSKLDESDWNSLWSAFKREQEVKERFAYLKGTIVERTPVKVELSEFYPLEVLVAGVSWPTNVDVTKREQYLADDDFLKVFGMSKVAFRALPPIKRTELKKGKKLF